MKKAILVLALFCCAAMFLTACTSASAEKTGSPTEFQSVNCDAYNYVFSVNRDLPSGYKLVLPYVELSVDEINSRWKGKDKNRYSTHEIEIFQGDIQVGYVDFFSKADNYDLKIKEMKDKSERERDPKFENISFVKEVASADVICTVFSSETPSMSEVDPLFSNYSMFLGYFPKKPELAFWLIVYDTEENAQAIYNALNLQFLHE